MKYLQTDKVPHDLKVVLRKITKRILNYLALRILQKYKPKVIAIVGSVGKTLTKEAIYLVLSKQFSVRKSEKSFTAEVGVPLTIIGCPHGVSTVTEWIQNIFFGFKVLFFKTHYPAWLILEIDNDKKGDLEAVRKLISPDVLIVTVIGDVPAHVENFANLEEFLNEERSIISSVKKDGVIIYNKDDETTRSLVSETFARTVSCSIEAGDITASPFQIIYEGEGNKERPKGMSFVIRYNSTEYPLTISESIGIQNEYASLLAFALGLEFKLEPKKIISQLSKYAPLRGRMRLLPGLNGSIILDDSYNSSPIAMLQAISVLQEIKTHGRKMVVIGDMLELGKYSATEHRKIASLLKKIPSLVLTVGFRAQKIQEELLASGFKKEKLFSFYNSVDAGKNLQNILKEGDVVLIKGSQNMRMERTVERVMLQPEDKKKFLVRQEKEWILR